jgi:uncharacterized membrane protein YfcA
MLEKLKRTEVWFKLVLLAFFGFWYARAFSFPQQSRQFPHLIAVPSLILTLISLITDFTKEKEVQGEIAGTDDSELTTLDESARKERRKRFWQAWVIILVSMAVGFLGGFLFSAFFLLLGFALLFGNRNNLIKNMILAVGITMATYVTFQWFMDVPLLRGVLW